MSLHSPSQVVGFGERVFALDWAALQTQIDRDGFAVIASLLNATESRRMAALYSHDEGFRSRVVMERHGYGRGEYRYFAYPLPAPLLEMRSALYNRLAPIANGWSRALKHEIEYPLQHEEFLARCHGAGQVRPTPLLLQYGVGDYNCLHQDRYGELSFPLQVAVLLAQPGADFEGGEFILTEQRARRQTRAQVVPLHIGDAVIFAVNERPVPSSRGIARATMRHGVSTLRNGQRHCLGLIFHDAL